MLDIMALPAPPRKRPRGLWKGRAASPRTRVVPDHAEIVSVPHDPDSDKNTRHLGALLPDSRLPAIIDVPNDDDDDCGYRQDDDCEGRFCCGSSSGSSKRRRYSGHFDPDPTTSEDESNSYSFSWDRASSIYAPDNDPGLSPESDPPPRPPSPPRRTRVMDTTTTAGGGIVTRTTCDLDDWEHLKDLFSRAAGQYESDNCSEALPLLRAVIHECHRFLICYQDPSVLFAAPIPPYSKSDKSPVNLTPPQERLSRDWGHTSDPVPSSESYHHQHHRRHRHHHEGEGDSRPPTRSGHRSDQSTSRQPSPAGSRTGTAGGEAAAVTEPVRTYELHTAFHAILGIALFMFGNLVAQDATVVLPGEPADSCVYWLAALDVFETGENLPSRTAPGAAGAVGEDWRMAIFWGRTLVCLADATLTRAIKARREAEASTAGVTPAPAGLGASVSPMAQYSAEEYKWPKASPFACIAARRPPVTRRMMLTSATANDLLVLAMDQFARGMFHMPHPQFPRMPAPSGPTTAMFTDAPPASPTSPSSSDAGTFSRPRELFTIASEVLSVAERLEAPGERQYWAAWADGVFSQMRMEADMDAWRGPITYARGRCWLVVGSARAEEMEPALEAGRAADVLRTEEAEEAREGLAAAVSFFERAKGAVREDAPERGELGPLLAEALLTLANLTIDENKREELYTRAQSEGQFVLEGEEDRMVCD